MDERPWTSHDDRRLRRLRGTFGRSVREISEITGRSCQSISARLEALAVAGRDAAPSRKAEPEPVSPLEAFASEVESLARKGWRAIEITRRTGLSTSTVLCLIHRSGLRSNVVREADPIKKSIRDYRRAMTNIRRPLVCRLDAPRPEHRSCQGEKPGSDKMRRDINEHHREMFGRREAS